MARRRRATPEQEQELARRQAALTALTQHPSWEVLAGEAAVKRDKIERGILTRALVLDKPVDPVEMAYFRGLVDGIEWFVKVPSVAETRLEHWLAEQRRLEGASSG